MENKLVSPTLGLIHNSITLIIALIAVHLLPLIGVNPTGLVKVFTLIGVAGITTYALNHGFEKGWAPKVGDALVDVGMITVGVLYLFALVVWFGLRYITSATWKYLRLSGIYIALTVILIPALLLAVIEHLAGTAVDKLAVVVDPLISKGEKLKKQEVETFWN